MDGVDFTAAPPGQAGGGLACLPHSIGIYRLAPNEWDAPVCAGSRGFSVPLGIRLRTDKSGSLARGTRPFGLRGICHRRSAELATTGRWEPRFFCSFGDSSSNGQLWLAG